MEYMDIGVEHLRDDPDIRNRFEGDIRTMKLASDRIDELLQALRIGCLPPKFESVNLLELLWEQLSLIEPVALDSGIGLIQEITSESTLISADPNQLGRCVLNILKNALEASKIGDTISVKMSRTPGWISLVIEDCGKGMDRETMESMWVPMFTTKQNGSGLGAFIARTIVKQHSGRIEVASEVHSGTRVKIKLPEPINEKST